MNIQTKRLILREFAPEDFEDVHEYSSDYETVKHMVYGPNTPEQTRDYLNVKCVEQMHEQPRMHYNMAIEVKDAHKVIGGISLHMNWRRDDAIIGVILNTRYSGHGYMTEALTGAFEYAFEVLGLHRVHAVCDVSNLAVQRVLEKVGMRNEGTMRKRGKARPEESEPYFDQYGYGLLCEEWQAHDDITLK